MTAAKPANGLPISRAAPKDRKGVSAHLGAKIASILSTRSGVGCIPLSRRAVTSYRRNPFASPAHPLLSYHDDQQLRPSRPLERSSPCCILVPLHPRLCHWWQPVHFGLVDPDHHALHSRCEGWSFHPDLDDTGGLYVATSFYACHPSD